MPLNGAKLMKALRVEPGTRVTLEEIDPRDASFLGKEEAVKAGIADDAAEIDKLQDRLYAEGRRALLVILQGTDTSGKDGTIRHVFNTTGPLGVSVTAWREMRKYNGIVTSTNAVASPTRDDVTRASA